VSEGVKCWGDNISGQLGNTSSNYQINPVDTNLSRSTTYTYSNQSHVHAVTTTSNGDSYQYDADGNMITRVEGGLTYTQTYDAENRLVSVTVNNQTTQFIYDGDGNMVEQIQPDQSSTLYVGSVYEEHEDSSGNAVNDITYYSAAGAMRVDTISGGTITGSSVYYILTDQLGSAYTVVNSSGGIVGQERYYPFGETRLSIDSMFTDHLYTSQRNITGLGIYYFNARFYDPYLTHFSQPDSIIPNLYNPQDLNRYSYVNNNPINLNDPSGHKHTCNPKDPGPECGDNPPPPSTPVPPICYYCQNPGNNNGGSSSQPSSNNNISSLLDTEWNRYLYDWQLFGTTYNYCNDIDLSGGVGELALACGYTAAWGGAHGAIIASSIYIAGGALLGIGIGCTLAEPCETEAAQAIGEIVDEGKSQDLLAQAQDEYPNLAGKIQLHHIFPLYLGGDPNGPLVPLDAAYHQLITNAFRLAWPYGQGAPSLERALEIMQQVYSKFPLP